MSKAKQPENPKAGGNYYRMPDGQLLTAAEYKAKQKAAKKPQPKSTK